MIRFIIIIGLIIIISMIFTVIKESIEETKIDNDIRRKYTNNKMKIGLLGQNIGYSKSKELFTQEGFDYTVFDTSHIRYAILQMKENKFAGFNVTTPYKEKILEFLDKTEPKDLKSVNFVAFKKGKLIGYNLDGEAFFKDIKKSLKYLKNIPKNVAILGSGGVVNSIIKYCLDFGESVEIFARQSGKEFENIKTKSLLEFKPENYNVIINTIPFKADFDIDFSKINHSFIYYDLNYADDRLVYEASENRNCLSSKNGFGMLLNNQKLTEKKLHELHPFL